MSHPHGPSTWNSVEELVTAVQSGTTSASEVVEGFLSAAEAADHLTNCVCKDHEGANPVAERARKKASDLDSESLSTSRTTRSSSTANRKALAGLPISVKECYCMVGTDCNLGMKNLEGNKARISADAGLVQHFERLGAISYCKTNIPQTMLSYECDNPVYGTTTHPLDKKFSPGGSSGGEGALIGCDGSLIGLGSDVGGSVRIPCHFCGIAGLKFSPYRCSHKGKVFSPLDYAEGQNVIPSTPGLMGRTIADLVWVMRRLYEEDVVYDVHETVDRAVPYIPWNETLYQRSGPTTQTTIGYYTYDGLLEASPACRRAVDEAVRALRDAGYRVVPFELPKWDEEWKTYFGILSSSAGLFDDMYGGSGSNAIAQSVKRLLFMARLPAWMRKALAKALQWSGNPISSSMVSSLGVKSSTAYYRLVGRCHRYQALMERARRSAGVDAVLAPVHVLPAIPCGESPNLTAVACSYTLVYNLVPSAVASVPVTHVDPEKDPWDIDLSHCDRIQRECHRVYTEHCMKADHPLPVGVQIVGSSWEEERVLRIAEVLEQQLRA